MNHNIFSPKFLAVAGIILFAAAMRIVPHYPNFTPIAAIALFGGAHLGKKWLAIGIPLLALFLSDLLLGFHPFMLPVYISFALVALMGGLLKQNVKMLPVVGASVSASILFFMITNFAVWAGSPYYTQDISGLMACYAYALPFFHTGLLGDLFYTGVFFGGFYLIQQRYPVLKQA